MAAKNQKGAAYGCPKFFLPLKTFGLRSAQQRKTAQRAANSDFSPFVVRFYDLARTYFEENCWQAQAPPFASQRLTRTRQPWLLHFFGFPPAEFLFWIRKSQVCRVGTILFDLIIINVARVRLFDITTTAIVCHSLLIDIDSTTLSVVIILYVHVSKLIILFFCAKVGININCGRFFLINSMSLRKSLISWPNKSAWKAWDIYQPRLPHCLLG